MNILDGINTISIGKEVNSVDARKVYELLKIKSKFATWITRRISKNSFIENFDYVKTEVKTNGRPFTEYYITFDMAKHLSMLENNEVGMKARKYFIEVEKEHRENLSLTYEGKDMKAIVRGYQSQDVQKSKKIEILQETIDKLIEENATLALPAPTEDIEPCKKFISELQIQVNKLQDSKDHFETQSYNMLQAFRKRDKMLNIVKSFKGKFLNNSEVYTELENIIAKMEKSA